MSTPLFSCSSKTTESGVPALFDSKEEAVRAAKNFGCQGAHQMGDKWMPCENHGDHKNHEVGDQH